MTETDLGSHMMTD